MWLADGAVMWPLTREAQMLVTHSHPMLSHSLLSVSTTAEGQRSGGALGPAAAARAAPTCPTYGGKGGACSTAHLLAAATVEWCPGMPATSMWQSRPQHVRGGQRCPLARSSGQWRHSLYPRRPTVLAHLWQWPTAASGACSPAAVASNGTVRACSGRRTAHQ